ncbi:phage terminase small subunit [Paenibacillus sp. NRS-1783]|uniref:phage terminase small subunit n=1 Tax=Paenibacillus sp. NRS-1783 TaxID=3233907 RepID=UPI003D2E9492
MSRPRSENRQKSFDIWERSGRTIPLVEIAKRLGISPGLVRKWKHEDKWEAKPRRKRGGQPGNQNAIGNKGGGAPIGNDNGLKNGNYAGMWVSEISLEDRVKLMQAEQDPRQILVNEIVFLEYREMRMMRYIRLIEDGWDDASVEDKHLLGKEDEVDPTDQIDGETIQTNEPATERMKLIERKLKTGPKLDKLLSIERELSNVQSRRMRCAMLIDQYDRNELSDNELRLKIEKMQLEVNKLKSEAW